MKHDLDDDACCIHCGFDAVDWHHDQGETFDGVDFALPMPSCAVEDERVRAQNRSRYNSRAVLCHRAEIRGQDDGAH